MPKMLVVRIDYSDYAVPLNKVQSVIDTLHGLQKVTQPDWRGPWYLDKGRVQLLGEMRVQDVELVPAPDPVPEPA